jgi:hypothetical protein
MRKTFQLMRKWAAIFVLAIISAGLFSDGFADDVSKTKIKKEQR